MAVIRAEIRGASPDRQIGSPVDGHSQQGGQRQGHAEPASHQGRANCDHPEVSAIGGDHQDIAVSEIDQAQYPVNQRIPDGDQGIETAQVQSVDDLLNRLPPRS